MDVYTDMSILLCSLPDSYSVLLCIFCWYKQSHVSCVQIRIQGDIPDPSKRFSDR